MASQGSSDPIDYEKLVREQQVQIKELDQELRDKVQEIQDLIEARKTRSKGMDKIYAITDHDGDELQRAAVRHDCRWALGRIANGSRKQSPATTCSRSSAMATWPLSTSKARDKTPLSFSSSAMATLPLYTSERRDKIPARLPKPGT